MTVDTKAVERVLPTRLVEEPWDMVLGQWFEAFRRGLKGDPPVRVEPLTVTRNDGVHAMRAKQNMYPPGEIYISDSGAKGVEASRIATQHLQAGVPI